MRRLAFETDLGTFHYVLMDNSVIASSLVKPEEIYLNKLIEKPDSWQHINESSWKTEDLLKIISNGDVPPALPDFILYGSDFQIRVLKAAAAVPYGKVRSYSEICEAAGVPGAMRAAGSALHYNPLPFIIPCHRVILKNGHPGGFAGGSRLKEQLLAREKVYL